jgi:type IV secretion system protein VirB3
MDSRRNQGLTADPLFVGLTRPAMRWGVTYSALVVNVIVTMQAFIVTKNLVWLLLFVPVHAILALVCRVEPRFFDLLQMWGRTSALAWAAGSARFWRASSYSPLRIDLPDARGRRRKLPVHVTF